MSNLKFLYVFFVIFPCNLTLRSESKIAMASVKSLALVYHGADSLLSEVFEMEREVPSSHRLGSLVQAERSDRHMVDLMPCRSLSVSSLQQSANCLTMRWAPLNSQSPSHVGDTSKQTQRLRGTILCMQTPS